MTPESMVEQLKQALGERLKSVVLYGSAAAGDFLPGASNFNLLLMIDPLGVAELDAISPSLISWTRNGHPLPLMFTAEQFSAAADAFAIEMLDIQQSRRVLHGVDLPAEITVRPDDLRLQLERELTGKLLSLRGRYTVQKSRRGAVADLMLQSLSTFLVLFRAALRLYQDNVPQGKLEALRELARHIEFDTQPFVRLFELKRKNERPRGEIPEVPFDGYLTAIEQVVKAIDQKIHPEGSAL